MVNDVNLIMIHSATLINVTQKVYWFLASWCREFSNGI